MKQPTVSLLIGAASVGLAIGWVAGSWAPWSALGLVIGIVLAVVWVVWGHIQLQRDIRDLEGITAQIPRADEE